MSTTNTRKFVDLVASHLTNRTNGIIVTDITERGGSRTLSYGGYLKIVFVETGNVTDIQLRTEPSTHPSTEASAISDVHRATRWAIRSALGVTMPDAV